MTDDAMRPEPSYVDLVLWALDRFPERIALVEENRELTYREVRDRISQLAGALRARGFGHGNGLMTLSGNASDALLVGLAVRTLGSWQGSLHPMGSADDQAFILDDSDALGARLRTRALRGPCARAGGAPARAEALARAGAVGRRRGSARSRRPRAGRRRSCRSPTPTTSARSAIPAARPAARRASCNGTERLSR